MNPIIGIIPSMTEDGRSYEIDQAHIEAISRFGGLPLVLPYESKLSSMIKRIDGLYLTGGEDVDPHYFNEEPAEGLAFVNPKRDEFEIEMIHQCQKEAIPILGVCRGAQVINVAFGGSLYQDLPSQMEGKVIQHKQRRSLEASSHYVSIHKDSFLFEMYKESRVKVNSNHHQAIKALGSNLQTVARSEDGVIEAIESNVSPLIVGVQWHPERLLQRGDFFASLLYKQFIRRCLS